MTGFDRDTIEHVARLARLSLSEAEVVAFASDLDRILAEFEALHAQPLAEPEPLPATALREDVVEPDVGSREGILRAFAKRDGDHLVAPRGL